MKRFGTFLALAGILSTPACTPHTPRGQHAPVIQSKTPRDTLGIVFDLSGSFEDMMSEHGWPFAVRVLKDFKRELAGEDGTQIVLAQISGERQGPIFDGSLRSFGRKIHSRDDFQLFLRSHAQASGSRVFDSIRETVDHVMLSVGDDTRAAVIILSDMADNASDPGAEERLVQAFAAFAKKGGSVGIYWCDVDKVARWNENLRRAGVKHFVVESRIAADPTFPNYER